MPLHVSLLGAQSITEDATGTVRTRSSRTVALVAYLALHAGAPQTRQRIAGLFWPDSTDAQALTNLRRELHHLRQRAGRRALPRGDARGTCAGGTAATVPGRRAGVRRSNGAAALAAAGDAEAAPRATPTRPSRSTAGTCCRACTTTGAGRPGRARRPVRGAVRPGLRDACRAAGDLPGALEAARRRIRLQPLEEVGYRALMELQADLGDRAGAREHLPPLRLGPGARAGGRARTTPTRAALERLMAQHAADRAHAGAGRSRPRPGPVAPRSSWSGAVTELGLAPSVWQAAAAGRPGLVVVARRRRRRQEPPGGRAHRAGPRGTARWWRRPSASRTAGPAGARPGRGLAAEPGGAGGDAGRSTRCGAPRSTGWCPPVDGRRRRTAARDRAMVDAWQRHRFFEGLARALLRCRRPMLLVLDNLQWCDQETLAFLASASGWPPRRAAAGGRRRCATTSWTTTPAARRLGRPDAGHRPAHRARARPAGRAGHRPAGRGDPRAAAPGRRTRRPAAGGHRRVPAARRRGDARSRLARTARCRRGTSAAVLRSRLDQASSGRAGDGRPGRRGRPRLHARPAGRGQRPGRRRRGRAPSTSCGAAGSCASAADGYDFTHDLLRDGRVRAGSARRGAGCCTAGSRRASSCCTPATTDRSPAQLAEQYARGGRPERAVALLPPRGRGGGRRVRARRRDPAAPPRRWRSCAPSPPGRERDRLELGRAARRWRRR